jgi:hypothetical protein
MNGQSVTVIWDRIKVNSLSASKARTNVGSSVTLSVQLIYEYNGAYVTSGSFTLNGLALTYSGSNGVWTVTDSKSTVQAVTYNSVAGTEGTYGLTAVNMNNQAVTVIWDRLEVYGYGVSDDRVNVGDSVTIWVQLRYAYDGVVFDSSKGTVSIGGVSATWDSVNSRWYITQSRTAVQKVDFLTPSGFTDNVYGLTAIAGSVTQSVVWDRLVVSFKGVDDDRRDVGTPAEIRFKLRSEYDGAPVTSGSVYINGTSAMWDAVNGWWKISYALNTVGKRNFVVTSVNWNIYGITALNPNVVTNATSVVWDRIKTTWYGVSDDRCDVGSTQQVRVKLALEYDNTPLGANDVVYINGTRASYDSANGWFYITVTSSTVGKKVFAVSSASQTAYGITAFAEAQQLPSIIWDKVVFTLGVAKSRINVGDTAQISVAAKYAYDSSTFQGSYALNDTPTKSSVGKWTFRVGSMSDQLYGLTVFESNEVEIIWDRIKVNSLSASKARADIGSSVTISAQLVYEYDGAYITSGSFMLNGYLLIYSGSNGVWTASTSRSSVGAVTFNSLSGTEGTYGLTAVNMNNQAVTVVWDKVIFTLTVPKTRINVGDAAQIAVVAKYAYDGSDFQGSYSLNDTTTKNSVGKWAFKVSTMSDNLYGLTIFETNEVEVIWDMLKIDDVQVDLLNQKVRVKAVYAYDNAPVAGLVNYLGLLAQTDAQGYAEFDLSRLSEVPFGGECYVQSDQAYGLTTSTRGTVAFCKAPVGPFSVRGDHAILNTSWNDVERKLKFTTKGTCIVFVGDYGQPMRVEVNGQIYTDWSYDYSRREVTIRNLASEVVLVWASSAPATAGGGGGGGAVGVLPPPPSPAMSAPAAPTTPATTAPVVAPAPAVDLVNVGIGVIVAAVVGGYAYSQLKSSPRRRYREAWRKRLAESRATVRIARTKARKVRWTRSSRFD